MTERKIIAFLNTEIAQVYLKAVFQDKQNPHILIKQYYECI